MAEHRQSGAHLRTARHLRTEPWWRRLTSLRMRAAMTLGILVSFATIGTMAYWADDAQVPGESFAAGALDLTINGQLIGSGGTTSDTTMTAVDLIPNESVAYQLTVGNAGSVPFVYRATGTATGGLAPSLRFSVHVGGPASNTGTAAGGNRSGTCGGTATATNVTLGGTPTTVISTDPRLDPGGTQIVCLRVSVPSDAPSSAQGQTATAQFTFRARNLGAPA